MVEDFSAAGIGADRALGQNGVRRSYVAEGGRRPYVKPHIRNLDIGDSEGKLNVYDTEYVSDYGQSYAYS
jgi:hypothetical protein